MNIVKRVFSVCYYRVIYPIYSFTIKAGNTQKRVKRKYLLKKGIRNIAIIGTPNHGNLGDYAIYVAEREILRKHFPDCNIFAVNMTDFQHEVNALKKLLNKNDILVLTGGGNLGNQYMDDEMIRRKTIQLFPNNQIVLFPQTMYFTMDSSGEQEKEQTVSIYNGHKHLWITARDEKSFTDMKNLFEGKVSLLPDVVLTMEVSGHNNVREGALLLLRNDVEKKLDHEQEITLRRVLSAYFDKVRQADTEIDVPHDISDMEIELKKILDQIKSAKLVVTDRLHGMVFAAITQTPCLVLDNYNHKVKETYKWISHLNYVKYLNDWECLEQAIGILKQTSHCEYKSEVILNLYEKFIQEIING